jgi:hypothetical protein
VNRGLFQAVLCALLLVLTGTPAWAHCQTENRVGGSPVFSSDFASQETANPVGTPAENPACGYDFASGVHKYLYAQDNPVMGIDPSGHDLADVMSAISIQASVFAMRIAPVITVARFAIATIAIAGFVADPEVRDMYIASAGSPDGAARMLAADIRFVSTVGSGLFRTVATAPNVITLRFNGGDPNDFRVKTENLQRAANAGGLTVVSNPSGIRDPSAQTAYRKAVFVRYVRYLQQLGMSESDATTEATKKFSTLQADHKIDLQVSGALNNPNGSGNLQMLDGTVNMSVGSQLQKEIDRLGLQTGDQINQVNIIGP